MMRLRDRVGLNLAPLCLRVLLGGIFLWAGLGKVSASFEVQGEKAAILAGMGVISPAAKAAAPKPAAPAPAPATGPAEPPAEPPATGPSGAADPITGRVVLAVQSTGTPTYTAADFPNPVPVKRVYGLALVIHAAANPAPAEAGAKPGAPYWPQPLAQGKWPVYLAWAVAATELAGGLCVLLGLFTRMWALGLAGVMLGAVWLTQIGPKVQAGKTVLGFLPDYPTFDTQAWQPLLFQLSLLAAAMALVFLGPGRASLDHVLLSGRAEDDDGE